MEAYFQRTVFYQGLEALRHQRLNLMEAHGIGYNQVGVRRPELPVLELILVLMTVLFLWEFALRIVQHAQYSKKHLPGELIDAVRKADKSRQEGQQTCEEDNEGTEQKDSLDNENEKDEKQPLKRRSSMRKHMSPPKQSKDSEKDRSKSLEERVKEKFGKSQAYGHDQSSFKIFTSIVYQIHEYGFLLLGGWPFLWDMARYCLTQVSYTAPYSSNEIVVSCMFVVFYGLYQQLWGLPFSLYSTFVLEEKHGFNKQTCSLFFVDMLKEMFLGVIIGLPLLSLIIYIIQWAGEDFYLYVFAVFAIFQLALTVVIPEVIMPWFNKFTPVEEGQLKQKIEGLAKDFDFPLKDLYVMDGSTRSAHSNAFFTGIFTKRIVLYDTLKNQANDDEIVAVICHEMGHWKYGHMLQRVIISFVLTFLHLFAFAKVINWPDIYSDVGFSERPTLIGLVLFGSYIFGVLNPLLTFAMSAYSRKCEFQADDFAVDHGLAEHLQTSLVKLQLENLSSMWVHPLFAAYHYDHPPLPERLSHIQSRSSPSKKSQ